MVETIGVEEVQHFPKEEFKGWKKTLGLIHQVQSIDRQNADHGSNLQYGVVVL
jgi:hypothetical protein